MLNLRIFKRAMLPLLMPIVAFPAPTAHAAPYCQPAPHHAVGELTPLLHPRHHILHHLPLHIPGPSPCLPYLPPVSLRRGAQQAMPRPGVQPQRLVEGLGAFVEPAGGLRVVQGVVFALQDDEGRGLLCLVGVYVLCVCVPGGLFHCTTHQEHIFSFDVQYTRQWMNRQTQSVVITDDQQTFEALLHFVRRLEKLQAGGQAHPMLDPKGVLHHLFSTTRTQGDRIRHGRSVRFSP